jgi:hypothetical protein
MINLKIKQKKWIIRVSLAVVLALAFINLQMNLTKVSADSVPVIVYFESWVFGAVFPGQIMENNFMVLYGENTGSDARYNIIRRRLPRPGITAPLDTINQYCETNPSDCYRDLCPHLALSHEDTGDALVGPNDLSDIWTVRLAVPAIIGQVAQDHTGRIVSENGEYGCDISIEVPEE